MSRSLRQRNKVCHELDLARQLVAFNFGRRFIRRRFIQWPRPRLGIV
jgi:hypothetical protein